ncbi:MAG: DUF3536 domain-containing protein [Bacteroidota bacterium]
MNRYFCIHGHFYQPPRENPWLEEIEVQDSAYPFRDWNVRISAECYSPNSASRIKNHEGRIIDIVNNYSKISFNFGPTLLSWMEKHDPETYQSILEADKISRESFSGHGSAIAQVYNHMIMPLANEKDKITQVYWGIEDFRSRFGREPEGMWLAETAVDVDTLEILAEYKIKYTILAPRQAARIRKIGDEEWADTNDASVDPKRAYRCNLPSGRSIALFFYDGPISQELAFGDLLNNGQNLAERMISTYSEDDEPQIVHIATDGETYGHHSRHGDMALAACLNHISNNDLAQITVYGEFLEKFPPEFEVEIVENTSWSCVHGVERWRNDCGCNSGREGWNQAWRQPLREALDWLRDQLSGLYEKEMRKYTADPWKARDLYIGVILDRTDASLERFFASTGIKVSAQKDRIRLFKLLEMQRHALLMYTSCGWFFDEISGIETVQVIMYAGRSIQLAGELFDTDLEKEFIELLEKAPSNIPEVGNGAYAYINYVKPAKVDLLRVAAHYAISTLFDEYADSVSRIFSYEVKNENYERMEAGRSKMAIGRACMHSHITQEESMVSFAVVHLGENNIHGGVRDTISSEAFHEMRNEMNQAFQRLNLSELMLALDKHFGTHNYSLWHLFKDESRKVYAKIMESTLREVEVSFRQIYENHYPLMTAMRENSLPLPKAISTAVEYTLNTDLRRMLQEPGAVDLEKLNRIGEEKVKWSISFDDPALAYAATEKLNELMSELSKNNENSAFMHFIGEFLHSLSRMGVHPDMWKSQNTLFRMSGDLYHNFRNKAKRGTKKAKEWINNFHKLENALQVKLTD